MQFQSKIVTCLWFDSEGEEAARPAGGKVQLDIAALQSAFDGK
jgi:hypothetical protein